MPIALDGIRTCISGIRAHSASDCTTTAGTPRVSRMKHFRHSPVSSIAKQSCMKDSNSYLRDRDVKHLQGPVCVCVCVCVCVRVRVPVSCVCACVLCVCVCACVRACVSPPPLISFSCSFKPLTLPTRQQPLPESRQKLPLVHQ